MNSTIIPSKLLYIASYLCQATSRNIVSGYGEFDAVFYTIRFVCIPHCTSVEDIVLLSDDSPLQNGVSAFMCATFWGHLQVVERILAAGVQPDLRKNVRITSEFTKVQRPTLRVLTLDNLMIWNHKLVVCRVEQANE